LGNFEEPPEKGAMGEKITQGEADGRVIKKHFRIAQSNGGLGGDSGGASLG